jgi:hypothetical protein
MERVKDCFVRFQGHGNSINSLHRNTACLLPAMSRVRLLPRDCGSTYLAASRRRAAVVVVRSNLRSAAGSVRARTFPVPHANGARVMFDWQGVLWRGAKVCSLGTPWQGALGKRLCPTALSIAAGPATGPQPTAHSPKPGAHQQPPQSDRLCLVVGSQTPAVQ